MAEYTQAELEEARTALESLIRKCEKTQESLKPGSSQMTLLTRRMKAFRMAVTFISEALEDHPHA